MLLEVVAPAVLEDGCFVVPWWLWWWWRWMVAARVLQWVLEWWQVPSVLFAVAALLVAVPLVLGYCLLLSPMHYYHTP